MAKAYLVAQEMSRGMSPIDIRDMNNNVVSSIYGPRRYEYILTYVSIEPVDFPQEIDIENSGGLITSRPIPVPIEMEFID